MGIRAGRMRILTVDDDYGLPGLCRGLIGHAIFSI